LRRSAWRIWGSKNRSWLSWSWEKTMEWTTCSLCSFVLCKSNSFQQSGNWASWVSRRLQNPRMAHFLGPNAACVADGGCACNHCWNAWWGSNCAGGGSDVG
jgi:hypothetical protein